MRYRGYRRKKNQRYKAKLRRIADSPEHFPGGAIRIWVNPETGVREYVDAEDETTFTRRINKSKSNNGKNRYRHYKHISNRLVRRYPLDLWGKGRNFYRRIFDYWWTVD